MNPFRFNVTAEVSPSIIRLHTDIMGEITTRIVDLEEQTIVDALVSLGWTPPGPTGVALMGRRVADLTLENSQLKVELAQLKERPRD